MKVNDKKIYLIYLSQDMLHDLEEGSILKLLLFSIAEQDQQNSWSLLHKAQLILQFVSYLTYKTEAVWLVLALPQC